MNRKEKLVETIAFRAPSSIYSILQEVAEGERRKLSEVALALMTRGLAARALDGQLFASDEEMKLLTTLENREAKPEAAPRQLPSKRSRSG